MSDTPRHDDHEGQPYSDPTAPGDDSFFAGSPSSADTGEGSDGATSERADAGATEHTEQLPTSGDTQQVPAPATPEDQPASPYAQPNPYAQPYPTQDELQQRRAHEQDAAQGAADQPGYGQATAGGSTPPPPPPGYGSAPTPPGPGANPYGSAPYGSAPYGSAPYGSAPYGSAPGYVTPAHGSPASLSGSTIALLVVSGLLTLGGCGTGIPALVFAILAVTKKDEPAEASKWTRWGWIALGITVAIVIVGIVGVFALAVTTGTSSGY